MNVLDDVLIRPATTFSTQNGMSFEERILKDLNDLKRAQKTSEENRLLFEARVEKRLDNFLNDQSRVQGLCGATQIRTQSHHHDSLPVPTAVEDFEDFEEFDQNFPIERLEYVEELEWSIRKDLEFKFRLVF